MSFILLMWSRKFFFIENLLMTGLFRFLLLYDLILVGFMFLIIYPSILVCPVCWDTVVLGILLRSFVFLWQLS